MLQLFTRLADSNFMCVYYICGSVLFFLFFFFSFLPVQYYGIGSNYILARDVLCFLEWHICILNLDTNDKSFIMGPQQL